MASGWFSLSSLEHDVERCSLCADGAGCAALDGWSRENAAGLMCSEVSACKELLHTASGRSGGDLIPRTEVQ
jgi:hypothetical protein